MRRLVALALIALFASCSGTRGKNPGVSTTSFSVQVGANFETSITSLTLCVSKVIVTPADGGTPISLDVGGTAVVTGVKSVPIATLSIPSGAYQRVEAVMTSDCDSGKSVQLVNNFGSWVSTATLTAAFEGTLTVDDSLQSVTLDLQPLATQLKGVTTNFAITTTVSSVIGAAVGSNIALLANKYASAVVSDHPLEYYRFEDTTFLGWNEHNPMTDSSGNGHHGYYDGVMSDNLQQGAPIGLTNYSVSFGWGPCCYSGQGHPYDEAGLLDFNSGGSDLPFTFEAWVNDTQLGEVRGVSSPQPIFARFHQNYGRAFFFGVDTSNHLYLALYLPDGSARISRKFMAAPIDLKNWHHVAATYDGSKSSAGIKLFLDGIQVDDTDDNTGVYTGLSTPIGAYIGQTFDGDNAWFGLIDEFAVYDHVLTPARVAAHYGARN